MKPATLYQNKDVTAFLFAGYLDIYIVSGQLELTEQVVLDEERFLIEYMYTNQFFEVPYTGQLSKEGHYSHWMKEVGDTKYAICDLCDLHGKNPVYFLETVTGTHYSVHMFDSLEEVEVFTNFKN